MIKLYSSKIKWQKRYWDVSLILLTLLMGFTMVANINSNFWDLFFVYIFMTIIGYMFLLFIYLSLLVVIKVYSKFNFKIEPISQESKKPIKSKKTTIAANKTKIDSYDESVIAAVKTLSKKSNKEQAVVDSFRDLEPKKSHKKLIICVLIFILIIFAWTPVTNYCHFIIGSNYSNEKIKDIATNAGFNYNGKVLFYKTNPELVDANTLNIHCPNDSTVTIEYGCYLPDKNKVYLLEVSDPYYKDIEYTIAAHEVLHSVFYNLDGNTFANVSQELLKFYNDPSNVGANKLRDTLKTYPQDEPTIISELHSFVGSEVANAYTSNVLDLYYSKYFTDINIPYNANMAFENKMDSKINYLENKRAELNAQLDAIYAFKVEWLDKIEGYLDNNIYYGDIVRYNQNVEAYNSNLKIYNAKVDAYEANRLKFNAEIDAYNAFMATFRPGAQSLPTVTK